MVDSDLRKKSKQVLSRVLNTPSNVNVFEKLIYNQSQIEVGLMNDSNKVPVESIYKRILYQVLSDITKRSERGFSLKKISEHLTQGNVLWKHFSFQNIQKVMEEKNGFIEKPFEVVEGILECPKCHSNKTYSYQKQCRSGDESSSTFAQCMNSKCNYKWVYSG